METKETTEVQAKKKSVKKLAKKARSAKVQNNTSIPVLPGNWTEGQKVQYLATLVNDALAKKGHKNLLDPVDLAMRAEKPAKSANNIIDGAGYKIVDLNSSTGPVLVIETAQLFHGFNEWNSNLFPWGTRLPMKISIDSIIGENFEELEDTSVSSTLIKELEKQKILRLEKFANMIKDPSCLIDFTDLQGCIAQLKGKFVLFGTEHNQVGGIVGSVSLVSSFFTGISCRVKYGYYTWKDHKLVPMRGEFSVKPDGTQKTLANWGFVLTPSDAAQTEFLNRGKKVIALNEQCAYVNASGEMTIGTGWSAKKVQVSGRAIVDLAGAAMFNERWSMFDEDDDDDVAQDLPQMTTDEATELALMSMSPHITLFSFANKKWGKVHVDRLSNINFRTDSFEKLVMNPQDKQLVLSLVRNSDANIVSDLIDNKGGGCVLLLHGKPGLGKTLTAEAVAETLQRPLYPVSVGELGVDPDSLERNLLQVLTTAQRWNAVLLLDEADVFLETRTSGDINRNAMVGTFLRLLEYYNGVLLLTTNRVKDIDTAFYSRVSLALKYDDFNYETRKQVVVNLLDTNGVELDDATIDDITLNTEANGRQIKNAIRIARFVARENQTPVSGEDVKTILKKLISFQSEFDK